MQKLFLHVLKLAMKHFLDPWSPQFKCRLVRLTGKVRKCKNFFRKLSGSLNIMATSTQTSQSSDSLKRLSWTLNFSPFAYPQPLGVITNSRSTKVTLWASDWTIVVLFLDSWTTDISELFQAQPVLCVNGKFAHLLLAIQSHQVKVAIQVSNSKIKTENLLWKFDFLLPGGPWIVYENNNFNSPPVVIGTHWGRRWNSTTNMHRATSTVSFLRFINEVTDGALGN